MAEKNISVAGIILAAGKGKRMNSPLPKVLHEVLGKPILERVLDTLEKTGIKNICAILGGEMNYFDPFLKKFPDISVCIQKNQLGTADAVGSAAPAFPGVSAPGYSKGELYRGGNITDPYLIICYGDTPSLDHNIIGNFIKNCLSTGSDIGVVGMIHPEPTGYGRLVIDGANRLQKIVEEKDADDKTRMIKICNTGLTFARASLLFELLGDVKPNNSQKEYYLTDCFELARLRGSPAYVHITENYKSFNGVNDKEQLKAAEEWERKKLSANMSG
ncbi:MAG: NTP transferase domain-containing protein [Oligoflexales bacterium]|nr:NTP transferase domain-containing protein [Oligoflexales bacterium]